MNLFVWYPKCSTCKKAYQKLNELGVKIELRDIKSQTPTAEELEKWWKLSGLELKKFFNTSGIMYKNLNLKEKLSTMTEKEQLNLLASDGMLIKRPILIVKNKIIVGYQENLYSNL